MVLVLDNAALIRSKNTVRNGFMSFLELDFCIGRVVLRQHQPNAFCFILSCSKKPFYRILQPPCEEDRQELLRYYSEIEPVPK